MRSAACDASRQEFVLLDEGWDVTLYVAVGLRNAGCTVRILTAVADERLDAKYLGRHITRVLVPPVDSPEFLPSIAAELEGCPSAQVLALTEPVLYRLWDANPAWLHRIRPRIEEPQRELLRDKARMSAHMFAAGVRIPEQQPVSTPASVEKTIHLLGLPIVVKGAVGTGGSTVRIAHTMYEVLAAIAKISREGSCFLQQHIVGPTFLVGGLFRDGEPLRLYAGEKTECAHPTGPSLRLRSERNDKLMAEALAAFRAIRWTGLASVDMMRGADGKYYFIEFNPRPWGSIPASAQTGVDLFHPLARLCLGQTVTSDLAFATRVNTTLFPQVACLRLRRGGARALTSLAREPRIWRGAPWKEPGLTAHLARRVWWTWRLGAANRKKEYRAASPPHSKEQVTVEHEPR